MRFVYFYEKIPDGVRPIVGKAGYVIVLLFLGILCYQSLIVIGKLQVTELPVSGLSQRWVYLPVPIFSLVMISYSLEFLSAGASDATIEES